MRTLSGFVLLMFFAYVCHLPFFLAFYKKSNYSLHVIFKDPDPCALCLCAVGMGALSILE